MCRYCGKITLELKKLDTDLEEKYLDVYLRGHKYCEVCFDKINLLFKSATTKEELFENIL